MGSCESANVLTEGKQNYPAPSLLLRAERLLVNLPGESGRGLDRGASGKLLFWDGMNVNRNDTCGHRARAGTAESEKEGHCPALQKDVDGERCTSPLSEPAPAQVLPARVWGHWLSRLLNV